MMIYKKFKCNAFGVFIMCAALMLPELASAASVVVPGSRPGTHSGMVQYNDGDGVAIPVREGWSYYCRYRAAVSVDLDFQDTVQNIAATNIVTVTYRGGADGGNTLAPEVDDAFTFTAPTTEPYYTVITDVNPDTQSAIIECFVTSLFGNFNTVTAANPFNFLEISNDSDKSVRFTVTFYRYDGTVLGSVTETLNFGRQRDLAVHDVDGASNTFGRAVISHNGPPESLRATLSKYIDQGGGSLKLIATVPYKTRENTN